MLLVLIRFFVGGTGAILCYTILLYENQERIVQNTIEGWWVRLDDGSGKSLAYQARFLKALAASTTRFLDRIFSSSTFSLQAIYASICYSTGIFILSYTISLVFIASTPHDLDSGLWGLRAFIFSSISDVFRMGFLLSSLSLFLLAVPIAPLFRPILRWLPALCAMIVCLYVVWLSFEIHTNLQSNDSQNYLLAFPLAILSQLYAIAITRRVLRLSALAERLSYICMLLILNILGLLLLVAVPFILFLTTKVLLMDYLALMNLCDGIVLGGIICLACIMVVHHMVWPFILKPIYLLQRLHFLEHKKVCVAIGISCLAISLSPRDPIAAIKELIMRAIS